MHAQRTRRCFRVLSVLALLAGACTDEGDEDGAKGIIRGRLTDVAGNPLADVEVTAEGATAHTDARGRFELRARTGQDVRLAVSSVLYSSAELPVSVSETSPAQVEVAVKARRMLMAGATGGRFESDDGFALELPDDALRDQRGARITGMVEVRYAMINDPRDVTAIPARLQATNQSGLDAYGVAEVGFYQNGARLTLTKPMQVEVPMVDGHGLSDGADVASYQLSASDVRWRAAARAQVRGQKVVVTSASDRWISAAKALPATSCVRGALGVAGGVRVQNTTVRAARLRGLSLIQAETSSDGSFCLPVTPDDDWTVSTYFDDGTASYGLSVDLRSDQAAGMCGGDTGCKSVGDVALPVID